MLDELIEAKDVLQGMHDFLMEMLLRHTKQIKSGTWEHSELCDYGFLCREMEDLCDELRKELKVRKELAGSRQAVALTKECLQDPTLSLKAEGRFATGTPDVKSQAALPKRGSEEYYKLTDHFGIPRQVAEKGVLKLNWSKITELCTEARQAGKELPPGLGKEYPIYFMTYRRKT